MSKLGVRNIASYNERASPRPVAKWRAFLTRTVQDRLRSIETAEAVYESEKIRTSSLCPTSWSWSWTKWRT